jgi:hypothetical protein
VCGLSPIVFYSPLGWSIESRGNVPVVLS